MFLFQQNQKTARMEQLISRFLVEIKFIIKRHSALVKKICCKTVAILQTRVLMSQVSVLAVIILAVETG